MARHAESRFPVPERFMMNVTAIPSCRLALAALALLSGCGKAPDGSYAGYVEGEVIYLAAPLAGYLDTLPVMRGARVAQGAPVFTVAAEPEQQGLREAQAREISAREKVANLSEPRRQSEVAAIEAQLRASEAALRLSGQQLRQQEALLAKSFISAASVDAARAAKARDQAQVDAAREQLATFRATLGRQPEVRAAQADVEAAAAQVAQRKWQVDKKVVTAQVPGEITETYYRPGEWVAAGAPVVSLLPDARRRVRFFVPETAIATLRPGQKVEARCDGCPAPIRATIDFIAPQAEYTPPVIYSRGSREKLVFRVEAAAAPEQAPTLRPGLPVDVRLVEH
jgi:HlyD family secretion protein